jgi:hypothetical protein
LNVPIKKHRDLIVYYMWMQYTKYQQLLCPGAYLCLDGVYTYEADEYLISTPFPCPPGSYCLIGADTVVGTALCPAGYSCPGMTEYPV